MSATLEMEVEIKSESDIVLVRRTVREAAYALGFGMTDTTRIVTAASELARNVFTYAGEGAVFLKQVSAGDNVGLELTFVDHGPGIPDVDKAMEEGYSTSGGLGLGLPGARRLMDEMEIRSVVGSGTTVILRKWRKP